MTMALCIIGALVAIASTLLYDLRKARRDLAAMREEYECHSAAVAESLKEMSEAVDAAFNLIESLFGTKGKQ